MLAPLLAHVANDGLGHVPEMFDGEPPFRRRRPAQAWSAATLLEVLLDDLADRR